MLHQHLPAQRHVVRFDFHDARRRLYWLVLEPSTDADVCAIDPGFDVDLRVDATLETLTEVYLGHTSLREAIRARRVSLAGSREALRRLPALVRGEPVRAPRPAWFTS